MSTDIDTIYIGGAWVSPLPVMPSIPSASTATAVYAVSERAVEIVVAG